MPLLIIGTGVVLLLLSPYLYGRIRDARHRGRANQRLRQIGRWQ